MSYKEQYADNIEAQFYDLENRIIADIIRRIKKTGEITSTADWQITRLYQLGYSSAEIEDIIKDALDATYPEMFELYDKAAEQQYTRDKVLYEQINGNFIPYEENQQLLQFVEAAKSQTAGAMVNMTSTLGIVQQIGGQMTFLPLTDYYRKTLDKAILDIASGAFDYNSVLRRTVAELSKSGIRTIDYDSGYSSRLPVAVRRSIMTGMAQMTGSIAEQNAAKLGTEYFEVTWHAGARPSHQVWQGKVYTKEELVSVCGLGEKLGLHGINCYHDYYPFFPGLSERNWTDEWLEEQNRIENTPREWRGKEYTAYGARQKQRQMETSMRAQRQKVVDLKNGGADKKDITIAQARYQGQLNEYKTFSRTMDLTPQMERVYIDGLGRVAPGRIVSEAVANTEKTAIIKTESMYRRKGGTVIEPMPKKQLQKIVKSFKKNGGTIQMGEATDAYLKSRNAEATTYNATTILLMQKPGRAAVFEELIHATQFRQGKNDGSPKGALKCEIEAQEKLLKYKRAYKLTDLEIKQTEKLLKKYKEDLQVLEGRS